MDAAQKDGTWKVLGPKQARCQGLTVYKSSVAHCLQLVLAGCMEVPGETLDHFPPS